MPSVEHGILVVQMVRTPVVVFEIRIPTEFDVQQPLVMCLALLASFLFLLFSSVSIPQHWKK